MNKNIRKAANTVTLFCRFQLNIKKDLPVRSSEMGVLIYIKKQNEPVNPTMISEFFQITKPSVTTMLKSLIKDDYLHKKQSLEDKRSYTVCLTDKAEKLVKTTHDEYFKAIEVLKDKMGTDDFERLIELLDIANEILSDVKR